MKSPPEPCVLGESQKKALISLLADDDPAVYEIIREKLLSFGAVAADWLAPYARSNDPLLRRRAIDIIHHFARETTDRDFLAFCISQGEQFEIEQGLLLLAKTRYPDINPVGYSAWLDQYADELRERIIPANGGEDILATLNSYLFDELKFVPNEQGYYDPQNSYLNRVLDRRTGNPLSLCLVYLLVARRLKLPMVGIGLPGHFLCRYQTARDEYYVDAFNRGKLLTRTDCIRYVVQIRHRLDEDCLAPVSPRRMLLRNCANLHQIYTQLNQGDETERLQHYLVALAQNT
jgi:regulator of sirC expression with transglutaminase-like and TPR domain